MNCEESQKNAYAVEYAHPGRARNAEIVNMRKLFNMGALKRDLLVPRLQHHLGGVRVDDMRRENLPFWHHHGRGFRSCTCPHFSHSNVSIGPPPVGIGYIMEFLPCS
jgi:hypothetical protein